MDLYFASKLQSQQAKDIGIAHGCFGLAQGVWLCVLAGVQEAAETIDAVIEIVLGLAELATTIASVILGMEDPSALSVLGFRLSSWALMALQKLFDGMDNAKGSDAGTLAKILNVGTAGLLAAVDIGEGAYATYGSAS